ncbi:phosphonate metabolism protein/1,5-bisphosphokinase (PRPP-forming) PhnN [Magnetospira thiophila]
MAGRLILVVGPSGAGKDTLLAAARIRLANHPDMEFPRRIITRPQDAGGEDHIAVSEAEFQHMQATGAFFLAWHAHGLSYGVPRTVVASLDRGKTVVVNVSRGVIDAARSRFPATLVAHVTAAREVLAERLRARGRETEADIERRLDQAAAYRLEGSHIFEIDNGRPLEQSLGAFLALLTPGTENV